MASKWNAVIRVCAVDVNSDQPEDGTPRTVAQRSER
jgi:hypothetical protein